MSLIREYRLPLMLDFSWRDKLFHALAYCILGVLFSIELRKDSIEGTKCILLSILLPIAFGGLIELLQEFFFAPRVGDWFDFIANAVGVVMAYLICKIFVTK